jgi:D-galactarolactone isomerase
MTQSKSTRRQLLRAGVGFACAAVVARHVLAQSPVPFSRGTETPRFKAPPLACDSHIHIMDTRFPASPHWKGQPVEDATVEAYRQFQRRIGTTRAVLVNPSTYGIDNRCMLDALTKMSASAKGVAVIDTDIADAELKRMAELGVTGVRVNFVTAQSWGPTTVARLEATAKRIADLGWHTQIYATADQLVELEPVLKQLPTPVVIDHLGRLPPARGVEHPGYSVVRNLLDGGRTWVKLSGAYLNTRVGPPSYSDATEMARAYAKAAPERVVWGSDWPHRGEKEMPDDAALFDLLLEWAPSDRARQLILVDNPQALYRFGRA